MLEQESVCNIDLGTELQNDSAPQNSKSRSDEADRLNFSGLTFSMESPITKVWKPETGATTHT